MHQGISLNWVWPLLLRRKPWFIVYHQVYYQSGIKGRLKKLCSYLAHNIAVSRTTAKGYELKDAAVIYNSFNSTYFRDKHLAGRRDIAYVGKVWRVKGLYVLIDAFNAFKAQTGSDYKLTIIGASEAEEFDAIRRYAGESRYGADIRFTGFKRPEEINELLSRHKIQVVPSVAAEAFGLVVLEGLVCGCRMIGSDGDGIAEAMNGCGLLFKKGDSADLCKKLIASDTMSDEEQASIEARADEWLETLSLNNVAKRYIKEFERGAGGKRK